MHKMRIRSLIKKQSRKTAQVSLTPLIDTALTLLVVFMVTAPIAHRFITVDLPAGTVASNDAPKEQSTLTITITGTEAIYIDGTPIDRTSAYHTIAAAVERTHKPVMLFLRVDKKASSGVAIELLSFLRTLEGVESVSFDLDHQEQSIRQKS